ncbi:MAG: phosphatidylinositol mannoside acyltransferase [Sporichthyaceae bacterium]|nr:phosphatidylinositol mannoside acyltransferase [Sporichthyaceae bacterium]
MSRLGHQLTDTGYGLGWTVVKRLPERTAHRLFRTVGDRVWARRGPAVRQLERNLRRVVGPAMSEAELRALSRRAMRSYCRYWCETFRLPVWSRERVIGTVRTIGEEHFRGSLASGRGTVVALPHMANWDHAGAWAVLTGAPLTTVAERLRPESLFERFLDYRRSLGMEVLPLGADNLSVVLADRLRSGRLVCLVADRDLSASGIPVDFFGEPAKCPPGPAALAVQTGAALIPADLWYEPRGLVIRFHPEIPVPAAARLREKVVGMTRDLAKIYEHGVADHPEDWHMLQRFWPADAPAGAKPDR